MIEDSPQWENQPATVSTQVQPLVLSLFLEISYSTCHVVFWFKQGDSTGKEIDTLQQKIEELHGSEELAEAVKKIMELKEVLKNLKSSTQVCYPGNHGPHVFKPELAYLPNAVCVTGKLPSQEANKDTTTNDTATTGENWRTATTHLWKGVFVMRNMH